MNFRLPTTTLALFALILPVPRSPGQETSTVAGLPLIDLDKANERQVVVDREKGQYLGHPTTLLLEDGKTILCVYPKGHGKGPILYKRSTDGGKTWSDRLPTPKSWESSKETPTLHRVVDAAGKKRIILFSGLHPIRMAVSEDDGATWSELKPVGAWGGIVAMASVFPLKTGPGHYMAMFHDDGRFFTPQGGKALGQFTLYSSTSTDGGLTWNAPVVVQTASQVHLCEPGALRSPDGKEICVLLRENRRARRSQVIFSRDEGKTWTAPRDLPAALTGDRHTAIYAPDGRLFISFRDVPARGEKSLTEGDWVAWVGKYSDIVNNTPGQYRVRLKDNQNRWDCAYPGVELLPDDTIVTTTYGHWVAKEQPFILSMRLKLEDLDRLAGTK